MDTSPNEPEKLTLKLRVELPRGVPLGAFIGMVASLEAVLRAFVRGVGLDAEEVKLWIHSPEAGGQEPTGKREAPFVVESEQHQEDRDDED